MNQEQIPKSLDEAAVMVKQAAQNKQKLMLKGGNTRLDLGGKITADISLSMRALKQVKLYEPGELTLVVQAGVPVDEIQELLFKNKQMLGFDPIDHRPIFDTKGDPTIGAVVACNLSGPSRIAYGACRDSLLGLTFLNGKGETIRSGGRVMKNVTGYDLTRLQAGAFGSLGLITEVALKVVALPETEATLCLKLHEPEQAVSALCSAFSTPYEPKSAAWDPDLGALIRLSGDEDSVKKRLQKMQHHLRDFGDSEIIQGQKSQDIWLKIKDLHRFIGKPGAIWRVSVKPTDGPKVIAALAPYAPDAYLDWSGGLVWLRLEMCNSECKMVDIRRNLSHLDGHAFLLRATEQTDPKFPVFHPQSASISALQRGLKAKFDPKGIFNSGRLIT